MEMHPHFVVHEQVIFQHTILEPPFGTKIEANKAALVGSRNNLVLITDVVNVCIWLFWFVLLFDSHNQYALLWRSMYLWMVSSETVAYPVQSSALGGVSYMGSKLFTSSIINMFDFWKVWSDFFQQSSFFRAITNCDFVEFTSKRA